MRRYSKEYVHEILVKDAIKTGKSRTVITEKIEI